MVSGLFAAETHGETIPEWNGPWSDRSAEWKARPEIAKALNVDFQTEGTFWMDFEDWLYVMGRLEVMNCQMPSRRGDFHNQLVEEDEDETEVVVEADDEDPCRHKLQPLWSQKLDSQFCFGFSDKIHMQWKNNKLTTLRSSYSVIVVKPFVLRDQEDADPPPDTVTACSGLGVGLASGQNHGRGHAYVPRQGLHLSERACSALGWCIHW